MIRLFVIDDHPCVADGIRYNLHPKRQGINIVGSAPNVEKAIQITKADDLDIFILDLHIPGKDPLNNVNMLKKKFPNKKIIINTFDTDSVWVRAMYRIGMEGYITKDKEHAELITAIRTVFNGEKYFPDLLLSEDDIDLTALQTQVIDLLAQDWSVKQISNIIDRNYNRTNYLLSKIRRNFKVKTNYALIARVFRKIITS